MKKLGRPPLPKGAHQTYDRLAVYPHTKKKILKNAAKKKMNIVDYIEEAVSETKNTD